MRTIYLKIKTDFKVNIYLNRRELEVTGTISGVFSGFTRWIQSQWRSNFKPQTKTKILI